MYMYYLKTFHLSKNESVNQRAAGGASKKPPKNPIKSTKSILQHHLKRV